MNIYDALKELVRALNQNQIPYALCGGMAMAVHGVPRATIDIDIMVEGSALPAIEEVVRNLGYTHRAEDMEFKEKVIRITRYIKFDQESGDDLILDVMVVTPKIREVWEARERRKLEWGEFYVVSREGLIRLKELRGSGTDEDDIQRLREAEDEG